MGWDWPGLYRRARAAGLSRGEFYTATPRELLVDLEVLETQRYETQLLGAWLTEYVRLRTMNRKRLESFESYLPSRQTAPAEQSPEQLRAGLMALADTFNLPVRTRDR